MTDAQTKEDACETGLLGGLDLPHDLGRDGRTQDDGVPLAMIPRTRLVPATGVHGRKHIHAEPVVVVRDVSEQTLLDHPAHELVSQTIDVHGSAAAPVDEALGSLRGTVEGKTTVGNLSLLAHDGAPAGGTALGHLPERSRLVLDR